MIAICIPQFLLLLQANSIPDGYGKDKGGVADGIPIAVVNIS
jgi:hypothetical protein